MSNNDDEIIKERRYGRKILSTSHARRCVMGCELDEISHYISLSMCVSFFYDKLSYCKSLLLRLKCHGNDKY